MILSVGVSSSAKHIENYFNKLLKLTRSSIHPFKSAIAIRSCNIAVNQKAGLVPAFHCVFRCFFQLFCLLEIEELLVSHPCGKHQEHPLKSP
jgi:hypothetical protein